MLTNKQQCSRKEIIENYNVSIYFEAQKKIFFLFVKYNNHFLKNKIRSKSCTYGNTGAASLWQSLWIQMLQVASF
jgi:hypothetical protein